ASPPRTIPTTGHARQLRRPRPSLDPCTRSVTPPSTPKRLFARPSRLTITSPRSGPATHQGSVDSSVLRITGSPLSIRGGGGSKRRTRLPGGRGNDQAAGAGEAGDERDRGPW